MKPLKTLLGLFAISILAIIITGFVLKYLGIEHGPLIIKTGIVFLAVNIVLYLLLLIIFVIRNLTALYYEKQQKIMGSRFRTRLVIAFVGLTFIPSILLFILSNQLINNTIDKWFSIEVQGPVSDSMAIARVFYQKERKNAQSYADSLAANRTAVNRETGNYKTYFLRQSDGSGLVDDAFKGLADTEIISKNSGDIIRAASPVREGGIVSGVVLVETAIPKNIVEKMESIKKAYNEYQQIGTLQTPMKFIYFLILTVTTLVIIFLALWIALRIAKGITIPIRSLVEATKNVADGDLNIRIDLKRDDEIGLLINSFNKMVGDIRKAYLSMEAIIENINTGVILLERSGRIYTLNNAACSMLNLDRASVTGKSPREILGKIKSEELNSMINQLGEKNFRAIEREIHANVEGKLVNMRVYITALKDAGGNFMGILVVFDDITDVIKAQRALAWQEVARRIAHEIKNPLTPIQLSTERLLKKWDEKSGDFDEVLRRSAKTIVNEVNSLRNLVNEFSRFGKMPKLNLQPTDIKPVIEEILNLYKDVKEVNITTSFQDTPEIEADQEQLKRALINLIDNAIHAKTENIWLNIFYEPSLESVRIEVIDDGIGIKNEDKDKLFLPYFSTKEEGTGLGLAIVDKIISRHRGYIRVKDNKPKGTQFIIELPVVRK
ncbi:MAG: HAMP domain-containing protein [Nitrospirae bacterium]|nr:HAMP domain-containing protein [Nitrospirota bacterium]